MRFGFPPKLSSDTSSDCRSCAASHTADGSKCASRDDTRAGDGRKWWKPKRCVDVGRVEGRWFDSWDQCWRDWRDWSEAGMARRLDWEKRNLAGRRKQSIADEKDFLKRDLASRWLEKAEARQTRQQSKPFKPFKRRKHLSAPKSSQTLDERSDPHHQSPGVDMSKPPWE